MSGTLGDTSAAPGEVEQFLGQQPGGPARTVDWRFARVQALLARQSKTRPVPAVPGDEYQAECIDEYIDVLRRFLRRYVPGLPLARRRLAVPYPGPYGALELHENLSAELQLAVQCRLLAGQSDQVIAQKTGLSPVAIHWFEKCFFNVREHLHAPDWISANVLQPAALQNLSALEGAWKTLAYAWGPVGYESLQSEPASADPLEAPADLEQFLDETILRRIRRQAALAVYDPGQLLSPEFWKMLRLLSTAANGKQDPLEQSEAGAMLASCVRQTLDNLNFMQGEAAVAWLKKHNPALLEHDSYAAELRDHQVYDVTFGNGPKYAHLKDKQFPPPRNWRDAPPVPNHSDPLSETGAGTGPA